MKRHLHKLEELEYLIVHRGGRGQSFVYELFFEHRYDGNKDGVKGQLDGSKEQLDGPGTPLVWGVYGGGTSGPEPMNTGLANGFHAIPLKVTDTVAGSDGTHIAS